MLGWWLGSIPILSLYWVIRVDFQIACVIFFTIGHWDIMLWIQFDLSCIWLNYPLTWSNCVFIYAFLSFILIPLSNLSLYFQFILFNFIFLISILITLIRIITRIVEMEKFKEWIHLLHFLFPLFTKRRSENSLLG